MTFAHPLALLWGLLAIAIVVLYWRRVRQRRETVTTDMFWERAIAQEPARSRWQRWRDGISLATQLVILALLIIALAEPQIPPPRNIVLVIDNSAGMAATDVPPSRLEAAKEVGRRMIEGLHYYDEMAILSAGGLPAVRASATSDQESLRAALEAISVDDAPAQVPEAMSLARELVWSSPGADARIVLVSDGCFDGAAKLAAEPGVELVRVGTRIANTAIAGLAARRTTVDPGVCQVFVEARNFSDQPADCRLKLELDGKPVATEPVKLPAEGRWQHVFEITETAGGKLPPEAVDDKPSPDTDTAAVCRRLFTAQLDPPDAYPADNHAAVQVPPVPPTGDGARFPSDPAGTSDVQWENAPRPQVDLRAAADIGVDPATVAAGRAWPPAWLLPAGLAVALLILEWCLYQRRWMS